MRVRKLKSQYLHCMHVHGLYIHSVSRHTLMDTITLCIKAHAAQPEHLKRSHSADLEQPAQNVISCERACVLYKRECVLYRMCPLQHVFTVKENVFSVNASSTKARGRERWRDLEGYRVEGLGFRGFRGFRV